MTKKNTVLPFFLMLLLTSSLLPRGFASNTPSSETITPYALYIHEYSCILDISDEVAEINASVNGYLGETTKCKIWVMLQQKSGYSWSSVEAWTVEETGSRASLSESLTVEEGETYRLSTTVTVWAGTEFETLNIYSETVTA